VSGRGRARELAAAASGKGIEVGGMDFAKFMARYRETVAREDDYALRMQKSMAAEKVDTAEVHKH